MSKYQILMMICGWFLGVACMLICYSIGIHWIVAEILSAAIGMLFAFIGWIINPAGI